MPSSTIPVESSHGLEKIKDLYLEDLQGEISQNKKDVWKNLCLAKAVVEIYTGEKMRVESLHAKLQDNYDRWASLISKRDPYYGLSYVPKYVTDRMFSTTDTNGMRLRDNNKNNNQALWMQWNATKSAIINFDNLAVKKAINRMPGKALPSGTDFNIFLQYLRYELYLVRSSNSRKLLGGLAAKEAGMLFQTLDPPTERDQVD